MSTKIVRTTKGRAKIINLTHHILEDWRTPTKKYSMDAKLYAGMPEAMKASVRLAAEQLSKEEGRKISMSEVARRLIAKGLWR